MGETADEDEITVVKAVERGWFWEDVEFDGVMNERMDDWDDEERIGGGVGKGEDTVTGGALGGRGIWELVFDSIEDKEASDRD